ncbi:hypothetical protein COO60DRAFT_798385 [Scenedesmus sp. NREL 46B-D3]|nr:hypothetical protein COO60DRAFT_798385 [Scenedesmus sp. NREL 46B-D3]
MWALQCSCYCCCIRVTSCSPRSVEDIVSPKNSRSASKMRSGSDQSGAGILTGCYRPGEECDAQQHPDGSCLPFHDHQQPTSYLLQVVVSAMDRGGVV